MSVVVVGAGQAGLAVSHELTERGVEHAVLERGRVGQTWRGRWDSFCLVTPNWSVQLPGHPYDGEDPDGYMLRDELVAYFERYAAAVRAPVREGVQVTALERGNGGFRLETSDGPIDATSVVLCTGAYQRANRPAAAASLPSGLLQLDVESYRNPESLPDGAVLVVGSGQSGCQVAAELNAAGREVYLACGRAPWLPRRLAGRDLVWWLVESGLMETPVEELEGPQDRLLANLLASGRDGGHDLHLRTLRRDGVTLLGHFVGADAHRARFADDLGQSVAWGDERHRRMIDAFRNAGLTDVAEPEPFDPRAPEELELDRVGAVIFAGGFRPDYASWVRCDGAFDELGFPLHQDCASTAAPGLYFAGVHFLRKRKSSLLYGVGEDAALVASAITAAAAP